MNILHPAAGDRGQQRPAGHGLQPEPRAARQVRRALDERPGGRHDLQRRRRDPQQAVQQRLVLHGRIHRKQDDGRHAGGDGRIDRPAGRRPQQSEPDVPQRYRRRRLDVFRSVCRVSTSCPREISVSGTMQYYTGFPEFTTVSVGNNTVSLTQGTTVVAVAPRGDTRLPAVRSLDMTVRRSFKFGTRSIEPRIDLYNLTNSGDDPRPHDAARADLRSGQQHSARRR